MSTTDTTLDLPWSNAGDVTFANGEDINFTTINDKILKLLDNDLKIYNTKRNIEFMPITTFDEMYNGNTENIIDVSDTLVWHNYNSTSLGDAPKINILFALSSHIALDNRVDEPSKLSPRFNSFKPTEQNVESYADVLSELSGYILQAKTSKYLGNILRADLTYYLCQQPDPSAAFKTFYDNGYRWGEILLSKKCLENLNLFTDQLHAPFLKFTNIDDISSSVSGTLDTGIVIKGDHSIFNDNSQKLMNGYPTGTWMQEFGSGWVKQGGIVQVGELSGTASTVSFNDITVQFPKAFKEIFNIKVQPYINYTPTELSTQAQSSLSFCPVYVDNHTTAAFTIKSQPCYSNNNLTANTSKKYQMFNVIWEAEGIL